MSYQPQQPDNSSTLKSINWGVWILVFVFVILPLLVCCGIPLLCGGGTGLMGIIGSITHGQP